MRKDNLERVLMARLMQPPAEAPWPVFYLIGCYSRASDVIRESTSARDPAAQARVQDALVFTKELAVSYAGLMLGMDMFPQVRPDRYMEAWHTLPATVRWRIGCCLQSLTTAQMRGSCCAAAYTLQQLFLGSTL